MPLPQDNYGVEFNKLEIMTCHTLYSMACIISYYKLYKYCLLSKQGIPQKKRKTDIAQTNRWSGEL